MAQHRQCHLRAHGPLAGTGLSWSRPALQNIPGGLWLPPQDPKAGWACAEHTGTQVPPTRGDLAADSPGQCLAPLAGGSAGHDFAWAVGEVLQGASATGSELNHTKASPHAAAWDKNGTSEATTSVLCSVCACPGSSAPRSGSTGTGRGRCESCSHAKVQLSASCSPGHALAPRGEHSSQPASACCSVAHTRAEAPGSPQSCRSDLWRGCSAVGLGQGMPPGTQASLC